MQHVILFSVDYIGRAASSRLIVLYGWYKSSLAHICSHIMRLFLNPAPPPPVLKRQMWSDRIFNFSGPTTFRWFKTVLFEIIVLITYTDNATDYSIPCGAGLLHIKWRVSVRVRQRRRKRGRRESLRYWSDIECSSCRAWWRLNPQNKAFKTFRAAERTAIAPSAGEGVFKMPSS